MVSVVSEYEDLLTLCVWTRFPFLPNLIVFGKRDVVVLWVGGGWIGWLDLMGNNTQVQWEQVTLKLSSNSKHAPSPLSGLMKGKRAPCWTMW